MTDDNNIIPSTTNNKMDYIDSLLEISRNNALATNNLIQQTITNSQQIAEHDQSIGILNKTVTDLSNRIELHEQGEVLAAAHRKAIRNCVNKRVYTLIGIKKVNGKLSEDSKKIRKVYGDLFFSRLYSSLYLTFNVGEYAEIKETDFDDAKSFICTWTPDEGIEELRREAEENWSVNHPESDLNTFLGRLL